MKTQLKKLLLMAALCLSFNSYLKAQSMVNTDFYTQMNYTFGNLDMSKVPNGILKDFGFEFANLQVYNGANMADSTMLNKDLLLDIQKTLFTARVTTAACATLPDPAVIDSVWNTERTPGLMTLGGLFYQYGYLDKNAYANNKITVSSNRLFDKYISGVWQNPYQSAYTVGFAPMADVYQGKNFNILLSDALWLSNSKNIVDHIEVDVADGLGYRTLTPNTNLLVNYADTGLKVWNFKLYLTNSTILQSHTKVQVNADEYHQNDLPVIDTGSLRGMSTFSVTPVGSSSGSSTFFHVVTTETYNGANAYGFVTVQYAPGHTGIKKPFIVAEGFDPGTLTNLLNFTGDYSISQFLSSIRGKSSALDNLIDNSYDIIYIDYRDGTDDIRRNALVVKEVIRWVNAQKALNGSTEKNVIMGQSMGGPLVRYALKKMENDGETHDVRLFISHDGAQQGANVPTGFQYMINHANKAIVEAGLANVATAYVKLFKGGALMLKETPAAKQMIMNYINTSDGYDNSVHAAWQTELTNLGYPSQGGIRNIAISNGSECGLPQDVAPTNVLFQYDSTNGFDFIGDVKDWGYGFASLFSGHPQWYALIPGDTKYTSHFQVNASATNGGTQVYTGHVSWSKHIFFFTISGTVTDDTQNAPSALTYDSFGGSYFPVSTKDLPIPTSGSTIIGPYHFNAIPTPSALDLGSSSNNLSQSDYQAAYTGGSPPSSPKNTPFNNFITAFNNGSGANEQHITFEGRNAKWLADELNGNTPTADCSVFCGSNLSLTGIGDLCVGANNTYTITNLPAGITPTWVVDGCVSEVSRSGNQITVQIVGWGTYTIKALISTPCGNITLNSGLINAGFSYEVSSVEVSSNGLTGPPGDILCNHAFDWDDHVNTFTYKLNQDLLSPISLHYYMVDPVYGPFYYHTVSIISQEGTIPLPESLPVGYYNLEVYVSGGNCNESSIEYEVWLEYQNCHQMSKMSYYPNPANTELNVSYDASEKSASNTNLASKANTVEEFSVKLFNDKGQILRSTISSNGKNNIVIPTGDIPNGTYYLHVTQGQSVIRKQIIVKH